MEWPRVGIYHGDGHWRFELKVAPAVRRLRAWTPVAKALAGARSVDGLRSARRR
jgi:hypothetical protein